MMSKGKGVDYKKQSRSFSQH